jgi:hypothetical protein
LGRITQISVDYLVVAGGGGGGGFMNLTEVVVELVDLEHLFLVEQKLH